MCVLVSLAYNCLKHVKVINFSFLTVLLLLVPLMMTMLVNSNDDGDVCARLTLNICMNMCDLNYFMV